MDQLAGREGERKILLDALERDEAELIAVYGRRRVGKTFLIKSVYEKKLVFEFSGVHEATLQDQLLNFTLALQTASKSKVSLVVPENWIKAFFMLEKYLNPIVKNRKVVIFFDEFPWIQSPKSGFLNAFGHFWNTWASLQANLVVVICGSAASWMIKNVVNNRGGLHNRITHRIRLLPFTLAETSAYLKSRRINLDQYQLLQLYMAMGGVPHYLKNVEPGESVAQAIDRLCFDKNGPLKDEFTQLYQSLFEKAEYHINIVKALAATSQGLTRNQIIEAIQISSGGTITKVLNELEESGFISSYVPFEKKAKDAIFKLSDEYSLFYLKFLVNKKASGAGTWLRVAESASWKSWSGLAFESICMKHLTSIKKAIGIADVYTEVSPWRYAAKDEAGTQIDLLFDRNDNCVNLCEIKFSLTEFTISKNYATVLREKVSIFRQKTKTRKTPFLTMITTYGVHKNAYYLELVQKEITMEALFG